MTHNLADDDFIRLAGPFRRELLAHCYRMLGSVHDAEDLVQETYLRAWRAYDRFEGRSSLRTWLHKIATTVCLSALESRGRRPLPTGLGAPAADPQDDLVERPEVPWLQPVPDALLPDGADPAEVVAARESTRLALIAALQHLSPAQRAVLLLREVLRWRASEVADLLGTSTAAVNSSLQRARAQLSRTCPAEDSVAEPATPRQRALLAQWTNAFEAKDVPELVELFSSDAVWEMPPHVTWYRGQHAIGRLIAERCPAGPGDLRLVPTRANGQPAFGVYMRGADGRFHPFHLQVLAMAGQRVRHVVAFFDVALFATFGLPEVLEPDRVPAAAR